MGPPPDRCPSTSTYGIPKCVTTLYSIYTCHELLFASKTTPSPYRLVVVGVRKGGRGYKIPISVIFNHCKTDFIIILQLTCENKIEIWWDGHTTRRRKRRNALILSVLIRYFHLDFVLYLVFGSCADANYLRNHVSWTGNHEK